MFGFDILGVAREEATGVLQSDRTKGELFLEWDLVSSRADGVDSQSCGLADMFLWTCFSKT